jgi:MFS family permease
MQKAVLVSPSLAGVHDPYSALRFRDFRLVLLGTFISSIGTKMVEVALGWELYERTKSALVLGGVGLVLIIPVILLSLPAGHIVDRVNRKQVVLFAEILLSVSALGLTVLSYERGSLLLIYASLLIMGAANAFGQPSQATLSSQLVPESVFENAATWNSSSWQLASVIGPGLGGLAIALFRGATPIYLIDVFAALLFILLMLFVRIKKRPSPQRKESTTWRSITDGLSFLGRTQILLAAITLDLFAVLLGGATTLLPIFASDVLHVGPAGLGWLRAAPSVGAVCIALILAHRPPFKHAGLTLLFAVAGFGLATIVFGLSHSFWLSLGMLFVLGGLDNISVVIRGTLLLTRTPDEMRGRVSAVNALFIGASNELGGFESGLTAQLFGPVISVIGGGIGTVLVVLLVALLWPEMRRLRTLREESAIEVATGDD